MTSCLLQTKRYHPSLIQIYFLSLPFFYSSLINSRYSFSPPDIIIDVCSFSSKYLHANMLFIFPTRESFIYYKHPLVCKIVITPFTVPRQVAFQSGSQCLHTEQVAKSHYSVIADIHLTDELIFHL